jgi:transposase
MWCVADLNDEYIANMEDVLATYERPLSAKEPVVCIDERPIQLLKNVTPTSRVVRPGKPRTKDYEYKRKGTANAFCAIEPKRGRHFIKITKNRKAAQFAEMMREISRAYPNATKIHIVMDNLNTHTQKSLVNALGPKRGAKLWRRFKVHYTPKHGSWLNQAETEISMFSRECLGKDRVASRATLAKRAAAWALRMNQEKRKINWRFTRKKARAKFGYSPLKFSAGRD